MTVNRQRRQFARLLTFAVAAAAAGMTVPASADNVADTPDDDASLRRGRLFISTNASAGNELLVYSGSSTGPAALLRRVPTGGNGTGAALGSQGAVTLSRNGRHLFVVNAGSNTLSTFAVGRRSLALRSVVESGGLTPTSVTENDGLVYVLNAGGSGNLTGFRNDDGVLKPITGAVGTLSASTGTAPAQVGFSDEGDVLVVTERNTNQLTSFLVKRDGSLTQKTVTASAGAVPFGFAFTRRDYLLVSEAAGSSVSSYRFNERSAVPHLITAALPNSQGAACWIAVTPNGRFAFSANAASSSISSFSVDKDGQLALLAAQAGLTGGGGALDLAVSPGGSQLHVIASRGLSITSFTISASGLLTPLGAVPGLPVGAAGLAAN